MRDFYYYNSTTDNRKYKYEAQLSNVKYQSDSWFTFEIFFEILEEKLPHVEDMGPEHSVSAGQKVKYLLGMIACDHEIMHMSKMMLAKDKQGMNGEFERTVDFLGKRIVK